MKRQSQTKLVQQITESAFADSDKSPLIKPLLPSGCILLDLIVGGGYAPGKIVNIVGDKSSGKTFLALEMIVASIKMFGKEKVKWRYNDAEAGFSFDTQGMYGIDIIDEKAPETNTIEQFGDDVRKELAKLNKDEFLIYILDSLDALPSEAEMKRMKKKSAARTKAAETGEDDESAGSYNLEKQKFMSEFFREMVREINTKNCLLVIISQTRQNIGVRFGEKYTRSGGKALDFYSSFILWLAEVEKIWKKDRVVGITVKARTKKAKIKTPFRECFFEIVFDYGIDDITSNVRYYYDMRTESGKGKDEATMIWDRKKFKSVRMLVKYIESHSQEKELRQAVIDKWNAIERSISSEGRKTKYDLHRD